MRFGVYVKRERWDLEAVKARKHPPALAHAARLKGGATVTLPFTDCES